MAQGKLKIHTENILPIIKKWLYSDKDIFLRELVANACDAISKMGIMAQSGQYSPDDMPHRIDITVDSQKKLLIVSDTGIGMSREEVETYIAQVAFSGAEEFLSKYQNESKEQIIGHFGLGFYSAYMVASLVEIDTRSYQETVPPAYWSCDGSSDYHIDTGSRTVRGTEITLHIGSDGEEYLNEARIEQILRHYCAFLPYPIYLNGKHINTQEPLWIKSPAACTEQEYIGFYHALYPFEQDPVFWVHLNVDFPFHLKGILYFPKIQRRMDWEKNTATLFCNRVFVSDNCKEILPEYLTVLRGAIDSPNIPLNVSRSHLQTDRTVRQLATHISKKVADRLANFYQSDKEKFLALWQDVEMVVKYGILQEERFYERAKEFLIWKTSTSDWTTLEDYLAKHKETYNNTVFYTSEERHGSPLLELYKERNIEVLITNAHIDTALIQYLEKKLGTKFQRLDGKLDDIVLDKSREKTLLDASGRSGAALIADFFRSHLQQEHLAIEAKSLTSDTLPAFLVVDEETRRFRDYMSLSGQNLPTDMPQKRTLIVNTNNKLVEAIYRLRDSRPQLAETLSTHLLDFALLSQKEFEPLALTTFLQRTTRVLEELLYDR